MTPDYVYWARIVRYIDGDTVLLDIDLGHYVWVRLSCRLFGINARERSAPGGAEAAAHLANLLPPVGGSVVIRSVAVDKYSGRFDGQLQLPDGRDAGEAMVADGYAALWDGRGRAPVPPWPLPAEVP